MQQPKRKAPFVVGQWVQSNTSGTLFTVASVRWHWFGHWLIIGVTDRRDDGAFGALGKRWGFAWCFTDSELKSVRIQAEGQGAA